MASPAKSSKKPTGRPSGYTPEKAKLICDYIANGGYITHTGEELGIPTSTIYEWLELHPSFSEAYGQAQRKRQQGDVDTVRRNVMTAEDHKAASVAKVQLDFVRWFGSVTDPDRWSEKKTVAIEGGNPSKPLRHKVDVSAASDDELRALAATDEGDDDGDQ
jgi:hypothetical protein